MSETSNTCTNSENNYENLQVFRFAGAHCQRNTVLSIGLWLGIHFNDYFPTGYRKFRVKCSANQYKYSLFGVAGVGSFRWKFLCHRLCDGAECDVHFALLLLRNGSFAAFAKYRRFRLCPFAVVQISAATTKLRSADDCIFAAQKILLWIQYIQLLARGLYEGKLRAHVTQF